MDFRKVREELAEAKTLQEGILKLISETTQAMREKAGNEDEIRRLADDLEAMNQRYADAIVVNTPAQGTEGTGGQTGGDTGSETPTGTGTETGGQGGTETGEADAGGDTGGSEAFRRTE